METLLKNNKGFAMALMTSLLPILVGAVLVTFAIVSFIQTDLKIHHICRAGGVKGQESVAPLLKTLLSLNPMALKLKLELFQARAQATSGNPAAIARLAEVEIRVLKFITRQQQLIRQSDLMLLKTHLNTQAKLWREQSLVQKFVPLFTGDLQVLQSKAPTLAVRPDSADSPPTYSPAENFATRQALEHKWQYRLTIVKPLQAFLSGSYFFEKSCAVTLKEENSKWLPQLKRDRF